MFEKSLRQLVRMAFLRPRGLESRIKKDESVLFFPTLGRPLSDAPGSDWVLDVHGWIFEPEEDSIRRDLLLGILREALGLETGDEEAAHFRTRARWFIVDNERGKALAVRLGDREHTLPASEPNGHFAGSVRLSARELEELLRLPENGSDRLRFQAVTSEGDRRVFVGTIHLARATGLSVVSDIDDTIKVSDTPHRKELLKNTFLREYRAVRGMAGVYRELEEEGATFHYVSASPWQLFKPLSDFLGESGFPPGTLHLKYFRLKDSTFLNLFASPEQYKLEILDPLLRSLPGRRWVLFGDSTEKDAEVYGELSRRFPDRVESIYIRDAREAPATAERLERAFRDVPREQWRLFRDAGEVLSDVRSRKKTRRL